MPCGLRLLIVLQTIGACVCAGGISTNVDFLPALPLPPPIPQEKGDNPCWFSPLSHRRRERIRPSFLPCPIGSIEKGEYLCWQSAYMCQRETVERRKHAACTCPSVYTLIHRDLCPSLGWNRIRAAQAVVVRKTILVVFPRRTGIFIFKPVYQNQQAIYRIEVVSLYWNLMSR